MSNDDLDDRIIAALSVYNSFLVGKSIIDSEDEIYKIGNAFLNLYSVIQDFKKQKEDLIKALEPFAKVGELFCADAFPGAVENRDACIYRPAKGQDWEISSGHLIDARKAIVGEVMTQDTESLISEIEATRSKMLGWYAIEGGIHVDTRNVGWGCWQGEWFEPIEHEHEETP